MCLHSGEKVYDQKGLKRATEFKNSIIDSQKQWSLDERWCQVDRCGGIGQDLLSSEKAFEE